MSVLSSDSLAPLSELHRLTDTAELAHLHELVHDVFRGSGSRDYDSDHGIVARYVDEDEELGRSDGGASRDAGWDEPTGYCTDHGAHDPAGDCPGCEAEEDEEGMQRFIDANRAAIDEAILRALDRTADEFPLDDDERRQWIANDEGLYLWARSEGVRV